MMPCCQLALRYTGTMKTLADEKLIVMVVPRLKGIVDNDPKLQLAARYGDSDDHPYAVDVFVWLLNAYLVPYNMLVTLRENPKEFDLHYESDNDLVQFILAHDH